MTTVPTASTPISDSDPLQEARRLIALAEQAGLRVRLMGGLAFHAVAPDWKARVERERRDIDLATRGSDRRGLMELLEASGYTADRHHNAVHGHKQLYFVDVGRDRPVDILIDRFEMCHVFEFGSRLSVSSPTLPLAELLLSKLQIVKINRKDLLDALILLAEHPFTSDDAGINLRRITSLTSSDWGWWRTVTENLERLSSFLERDLEPHELDVGRPHAMRLDAQLEHLRTAIDAAAKSSRWRLRAMVGERMPWYEDPEELTRR